MRCFEVSCDARAGPCFCLSGGVVSDVLTACFCLWGGVVSDVLTACFCLLGGVVSDVLTACFCLSGGVVSDALTACLCLLGGVVCDVLTASPSRGLVRCTGGAVPARRGRAWGGVFDSTLQELQNDARAGSFTMHGRGRAGSERESLGRGRRMTGGGGVKAGRKIEGGGVTKSVYISR